MTTMEETVHGLLRGVGPEAFGLDTLFVCPADVKAPAGFEDQWAQISPDREVDQVWHKEAMLAQTFVIIVFAMPSDERQRSAVVALGTALGTHPSVSPPVILVPIPDRCAPNPAAQSKTMKSGVRALLTASCIDSVIWGMPSGFSLSFNVQAKVSHIDNQLFRLQDRMLARSMAAEHLDSIRESMHRTNWHYLRAKCFHAIPRMRNVAEDDHSVGGLQLGPKVSRGVFGTVRVASRPATEANGNGQFCNMLVIEKMDRAHCFRDMHMINSFLALMHTMSNARHPRLANLLGVIHSPTRLCICMESCGSSTLFTRLRFLDGKDPGAKPLSANKIRCLITQVNEAISHLHNDVQICHRDIKPENMIIKEEGDHLDVRVGGFELATLQRTGSKCKMACGTLPFAAPEAIVTPEGGYDGFAADMWSLGVLCMEVACGLRSVEKAIALPHGLQGSSRSQSPSLEIAQKIEATFSKEGFCRDFFDKCRPEAVALKPWLTDLVTRLIKVLPPLRPTAESLRKALEDPVLDVDKYPLLLEDVEEDDEVDKERVADRPVERVAERPLERLAERPVEHLAPEARGGTGPE